MQDNFYEIMRIELRYQLEYKPLNREATLGIALRKLPAAWTKPMCEALGIAASSRDPERKIAIHNFLISPNAILSVWERLPEPSRQLISWLVLEKGGSTEVRELYDKFGVDDDISYFWDKDDLPTTALGLLRLHGLVYKGLTDSELGKVKAAVVPVEIRESLANVAKSPLAFDSAPPMPEPASRKTIDREEKLEVISAYRRPKSGEFKNIYRFIITLEGVKPPVWRRILVPEDYSFWDLHVAIQDAMGWVDYHLHEFNIVDPDTGKETLLGIPDDDFMDDHYVIDGNMRCISDYFSMKNPRAEYLYDFGDSWFHEIRLEAISLREDGINYPVCTDGERACPPEDCGGVDGYAHFLKVIKDPFDEEYLETVAWIGGSFDAEQFNPSGVHFDDPQIRWKSAFMNDEEAYETLLDTRPQAPVSPPVTYKNRMGDIYYLRLGTTKTGKTTLFFSKKADEPLVRVMPEGFEVCEHPDGRVYPRIMQDMFIAERERLVVESAVKATGIEHHAVEVMGRKITIFLGDIDESVFLKMLGLPATPVLRDKFHELLEQLGASLPEPKTPPELLNEVQSYSPMMRFILDDEKQRTFTAERICFYGDFEDWAQIGGPDHIDKIANRFCGHLGKDSFYEL